MTDVTAAGAEAGDATVETGGEALGMSPEETIQAEHASLVKRVEKAQAELEGAQAALAAAGG